MLALLAPHQYPLFSAAILSLILLIYLRWHWSVNGVKALSFLLLAAILWAAGAGFEDSVASYAAKVFWHKVGQTGAIWLPVTWLFFTIPYLGKTIQLKTREIVLLSLIPALLTLVAWTNDLHGLFWTSLKIDFNEVGHSLKTTAGPAGLTDLLYGNLLYLINTTLLTWRTYHVRGHRRGQMLILLLCTLITWLAHLSIFLFPSLNLTTDPTPYTFNFTALLFVLGLLRYRLLNIVPSAFQTLFGGIPDGILVLYEDDRIANVNAAIEKIIGRPANELVGRPIQQALENFPNLVARLNGEAVDIEEIKLQTSQTPEYFELELSPLRDQYGYSIGRLVRLHNITKRILAESASRHSQMLLKNSEEKYRGLVENIDEIVYAMDLEGRLTYVSEAIEQYTGFSLEYLIGQPFHRFIYAEDLPAVEENLKLVLSGETQTIEFRIHDNQGNIRWIRGYGQLVRQDGRPYGLQGFASDITERKQVEEALERRASQLTMLNIIGEQIAALIELKSVLELTPRLIQKHFGYYHVAIFTPDYARGELIMRSASGAFSELFPENHHLKFGQGMVGWAANNRNTLLSNDVRLEPRYTNLLPDKIFTRSELAVPILVSDELVGILDIQSPLVNAFDDNDVRVMETIADQIAIAIENARLYEEVRRQLKEREYKENMLRIQRDLLFKVSTAKRLEETLQVAVETLAAELPTTRVAISLVDWDCQHILPVASKGFPVNSPVAPTPLDGNIAGWVARNAEPALIADTPADPRGLKFPADALSMLCVPLISNTRVIGVICLASAVTNAFSQDDLRLLTILANSLITLIERARLFEDVEQARVELEKRAAELEAANASLREMDRLKSQFLANMSHELRTPLNSIIGFSEVLIDELAGEISTDQKEFVQDILDSGRHLLTLINDVLDFSKIDAGHMAFELSNFEVKALFDELRITISPLVDKKSQTLIFRENGPLPCLTADHLRLKQVFINLLSNANKFTPEGGTITVTCQLVEPNRMLFSIADTGIGLQPDDHELIFEAFRQVDGSMTREVAGTGLGLSISKRIVEMHNGQIWVESELGKGATFFVRLPVCCSRNSP